MTDRTIGYAQLENGFAHPPEEARLRCYWWWLNSMATKASITRDLEEMKAKGYGGASIVDAGSSNYSVAVKTAAGPVFMSAEWMELYQHAVREADRIGIELSVNIQSGWNPGAPSITGETALKKLVYSETPVSGGGLVKVALPQPETRILYRDVIVQAIPLRAADSLVRNEAIAYWDKKSLNRSMGSRGIYPLHQLRDGFENPPKVNIIKKDEVIDLTAHFDGQYLNWQAPEGDWLVIRYGWTCTGARTSTTSDGWSGLSLDHLNPEAFEVFRKTVIQPLIDSAKAAGNSVRYLQTDSWEMGTVNWTNRFPEEFKKFRGYSLEPYLPIMTGRVVESRDVTNRFLHDLRKTVGDCVREYHYRLFAELAHKNGLGIHPESGGPHSAPVDALQTMAVSDFPQGEFWARSNTHRVSDAERLAVKQSACVAHTNGKRFVGAEGPTSIGPQWERSPRDLKANLDRIFCSGVNRIVWHTFTSSPEEYGKPGNEYFAGTHLNPNVTWWKHAGDFIHYLNRSSFLLQQGTFVADVLYYYGDDVPNFVFLKEEYPELNFGYDWDKCSRDVVLNRLSVEDGKIMLPDGMQYRLLVLPPARAIDLEVLRRVETLVKAGMTVLGPRPEETTGLRGFPESDAELSAIAERLWGRIDGKTITVNQVGRGRVVWGQDVNDVLREMKVRPDFAFASPDTATALDYIHRSTDASDIYFVVNRYSRKGINDFKYRYLTDLPDRFEQVEVRLRVSGKVPYYWNPLTGETRPVSVYRDVDGETVIPLHLPPEGSMFIVLTEGRQEKHIVKIEKDGSVLFPGNRLAAGERRLFSVENAEGKWQLVVREPGNYTLHWSDGSVQTVRTDDRVHTMAIDGDWTVHFDSAWGAPESAVFDTLFSWTASSDDGIKYYSGSAVYEKTFRLKKKDLKRKKVLLDLGNLHEMAVVSLNGHTFSLSWAPPYTVDVTRHLHAGENKLKVEVTNLWPNRLIGDGKLPPEAARLTRTNINKFDGENAASLMRESGLLGPVSLKVMQPVEVKAK